MTKFDFRRVFGADQPTGHRGAVLAPTPWLADPGGKITDLASGTLIDRGDLTLVDSPMWRKLGLALATYRPPAGMTGAAGHLRVAMVTEELRLLDTAVHDAHQFLSTRHSGGVRLSTHPVVVQRMGALIAGLHALAAADLAECARTDAGLDWLTDEIDTAASHLIKLVGGRAMLADNAVELRTLVTTLNRIYLQDGTCSN